MKHQTFSGNFSKESMEEAARLKAAAQQHMMRSTHGNILVRHGQVQKVDHAKHETFHSTHTSNNLNIKYRTKSQMAANAGYSHHTRL